MPPTLEKLLTRPVVAGESEDAHQQVYQQGGGYENPEKHEGSFGHELIGGAAAFEGMKLFEDRQRKEGMLRSVEPLDGKR